MSATEERTNLERLMGAEGITTADLMKVIGCKTPKTALEKIRRVRNFSLPEAKAIRDTWFPDYEMEFIFKGYDELRPVQQATEPLVSSN